MIIHFIGTGAPQLAVMVVLAMSVAVLLNGSELVISEAAVSAMLLVMTGPSGGGAFSPNRILEAVIGGAVALAVTLLFSPDPILPVSRAAQAVFGRLGRALERTATALDEGDAGRAEQALEQARSIDGLLREFDDALTTSRETVRTAPTRFGDREPIDRYDRTLGQIDLAVRNTRVLARHSLRAIRAGENPAELRDAVNDLAGSVWALAASYDEPERAEEARDARLLRRRQRDRARRRGRARAGRGRRAGALHRRRPDARRRARRGRAGGAADRGAAADAGPDRRDAVGADVQRTGGVLR